MVSKMNCHPDRSVAKRRDLRCAPRPSQILEFSRRLFSPGFSRPALKRMIFRNPEVMTGQGMNAAEFFGSPLLQQGELDFSPAEKLISQGLALESA
jgi:hypothetical protein